MSRTTFLSGFAGGLLSVPEGMRPAVARIFVVGKVGYPAGAIIHAFFVLIFWHLDLQVLCLFNVASVALWIWAWWWLLRSGDFKRTFILCTLVEIPIHGVLATAYLGIESGFLLYVLYAVWLTTLAAFMRRRLRIVLSVLFSAVFVASGAAAILTEPYVALSGGWLLFFFCLNASCFALMSAVFMAVYEWAASKAENELQIEFERAEGLLRNILPAEIAERLKEDPNLIAEEFANVTILFADIVGFTETSAKLGPAQLVDHLNTVFSHFDDLVARHGVEKIKTIGDAYMVVAGLPKPRADHAQVMMALAREMLDTVNELNAQHDMPLKIRIGINSGPVVAGVIGHKKFAYDLWGDAVNVAARMEQLGEPGRILFTKATRDLIDGQFDCEEYGILNVKGKGEMPAYSLVS